jgi:hypothetical protein
MINIGTCVNYLCNPSLFSEEKKDPCPISVTFCIPGNNFTTGFFNSWTKLLFFLKANPTLITPHFVNYYSPNIYALRNAMLGGKQEAGNVQLPFAEDFESAYVFWLDSDMVFEPLQVLQTIYKMEKYNLDILSGMYYTGDGKTLTVLKDDSEECLKQNGSFKYYSLDELKELAETHEAKICEVSNVGLGFVCVRNEMFEKIDYPWFQPEFYKNMNGFYNEDLSIFRKFKSIGAKVYCDTTIIVGHDKTVTLK